MIDGLDKLKSNGTIWLDVSSPHLLYLSHSLYYINVYYLSKIDSDSEVDSDFDGAGKKTDDDAVADLAQDVALAQYKLRMWKEKNEANKIGRKAKV